MANHEDLCSRATGLWHSGQPLEAGRLVFENLKAKSRPLWAASILQTVVHRTGINIPPVYALLQIAGQPSKWREAHRGFSAIRQSTLELEHLKERTSEQELSLAQLYLAENVAKVIYNATDPADPFDEDAGWWIATCAKRVIELLSDDKFGESLWAILCGSGHAK